MAQIKFSIAFLHGPINFVNTSLVVVNKTGYVSVTQLFTFLKIVLRPQGAKILGLGMKMERASDEIKFIIYGKMGKILIKCFFACLGFLPPHLAFIVSFVSLFCFLTM